MDTTEYLRRQFATLHRLYDHVISDLTEAQVNHKTVPAAQPIAFSLWHYVRTEDNIIRFVIERRPTVWLEGGWPDRFGLDSKSQGTGMTDGEASAVRISSLVHWRAYQTAVWAATTAYLERIELDDLEGTTVAIRPVGAMSLLDALSGMCLNHGYRHLGEIEYARGLVGLRGATI